MKNGLPAIALIGVAAAYGAAALSLALAGLGLPFMLASLLAAICAGLVIYAAGRVLLGPPPPPAAPGPDLAQLLRQLDERSALLRHDLRGVLSPALMMADRLLNHDDPAIRRAGQAVVRSVERATALLAENKKEFAAATGAAAPDAAAPPPPPPPAETGARSP